MDDQRVVKQEKVRTTLLLQNRREPRRIEMKRGCGRRKCGHQIFVHVSSLDPMGARRWPLFCQRRNIVDQAFVARFCLGCAIAGRDQIGTRSQGIGTSGRIPGVKPLDIVAAMSARDYLPSFAAHTAQQECPRGSASTE
jgi:hypothetical protein